MAEPKKLPTGIRERHGGYQVRYYGPDGRERCKSFSKITDAKKFRAAVVTDKARGQWRDPKNAKTLFSDVAEAHLSRKIKLRPRTAENTEALCGAISTPPSVALLSARSQATRFRIGSAAWCATD